MDSRLKNSPPHLSSKWHFISIMLPKSFVILFVAYDNI